METNEANKTNKRKYVRVGKKNGNYRRNQTHTQKTYLVLLCVKSYKVYQVYTPF